MVGGMDSFRDKFNGLVKESDWKLFRKNFRDGRKPIWES